MEVKENKDASKMVGTVDQVDSHGALRRCGRRSEGANFKAESRSDLTGYLIIDGSDIGMIVSITIVSWYYFVISMILGLLSIHTDVSPYRIPRSLPSPVR